MEYYNEKHEIYIRVESTKNFETHFYRQIDEIIYKPDEKYNWDNEGIEDK